MKTELYFFEGNLNSERYQTILDETLPPEFAPDCPKALKKHWYFIQDNARIHKTDDSMNKIREFVSDRVHELRTLPISI